MIRSRTPTTKTNPMSSGKRAEPRRFEDIAHLHGRERRHVGVGEERVELADDEQQEDQAAEAGDGFLHRLDDVDAALDRAGADAIGQLRPPGTPAQ